MCKYKNYEELPVVLTALEVGAVLGISKNNAYALMHSEGFPCIKLGKQYRVPKDKFIHWIEKQSNIAA